MTIMERYGQLKEMWDADAAINREKIMEEIGRTPILLSKWMDIPIKLKMDARKEQENMIRLLRLKTKYYHGELDKDTLAKLGWKQYQGNKPLKSELDKVLKQDSMVVDQETIIEQYNMVIEFVENGIGYLRFRDRSCATIFEGIKFYAGA